MSDSARETPRPPEAAQPFVYRPPNGTRPRGLGQGGPSNPESASGAAWSDESARAYEKGVSEGQSRARTEHEKALAAARSQVSDALRTFSKSRAEYFGQIESQVVQLSLSIARKILHRESQIDPLLLTGVVHVALQKLNGDTRVRLRAHPDEVRFWNEYFKQSRDIPLEVEVSGDPSLAQGQCTLETDFGTTVISLDAQLDEIEQGFFDLLESRPKEQA